MPSTARHSMLIWGFLGVSADIPSRFRLLWGLVE